jgi:NADPH:quinone reductase
MRAVQMSRFGGPDVFEVIETPTPSPGPGQVLVRVRAAGVNLSDTLIRQNRYAITPELPAVLGNEVAGVIEQIGPGVAGLAAGARVVAPLFAAGAVAGGYAEYVLIDANFVAPLPDPLSFEDATALMVQGLKLTHYREAPRRGCRIVRAGTFQAVETATLTTLLDPVIAEPGT